MVSLFMNTNSHPNLFKNDSLEGPNQSYFKSDHVKELLEEHNRMNDAFQKSMKSLRISMQKHRYSDDKRFQEVVQDLDVIKEKNKHHVEFEREAREWIMMLERNNQEIQRIVSENSTFNQDILKEIQKIHQSNEEVMQKLMNFDTANEQVASKIDEMVGKQEVITDQVLTQKDKHEKVMEKLENQEALMEKSYLQLNNLRSILFERTGFIAEKVEESYKLTSAVLYKFLTGSDNPLTLLTLNQKKEAKKNEH